MTITLNGSSGEIFPTWTTSTRPSSPSPAQTGYNSSIPVLEFYNGTSWQSLGQNGASVTLNGSSSGAVTLVAPSVAGTNTVTVPAITDTLVGLAASQTLTNKTLTRPSISAANLAAGTASLAPLNFVPGTNLTTAITGAFEYDGSSFYGTPTGAQRGVIPGQQFFVLNSTVAGASATGNQSLFGLSNGVTLSSSTVYAFEIVAVLSKSAGVTSHTISFGFTTSSASFNNVMWDARVNDWANTFNVYSGSANQQGVVSNNITPVVTTGAITAATTSWSAVIRGILSVNAGGSLLPVYALSAAPGSAYSTQIGSYMRIYPIGTAGSNISVGTWA